MSSSGIVIVDSGGANLASLRFAVERLGVTAEVSDSRVRIGKASHVILPGVGSAANAMERLRAAQLDRLLPALTQPVLGICLGMQLLYEHSAEGDTPTLGILPGSVRRLEATSTRPVPHMGWNRVQALRDEPLLSAVGNNQHMYFVHSFAAAIAELTTASVDYGEAFTAIVRRNNFWGVQFHPERSAAAGAKLLATFVGLPA